MSTGRERPPFAALVPAAVAVAFFALPLAGILRRVRWSGLGHDLTAAVTVDAARLSLVCSLGAAFLATLFGVPLAWVLAQGDGVIPIPGTKTPKYLSENAAAADIELSAGDLAELDVIPAPVGGRY